MVRAVFVMVSILGAQLVAFAATSQWRGLGTQGWHHVASLVGAVAVSLALGKRMARSRRFLAVGILITSILASLSGFWLLYWKEGIRSAGYQDWGVFWHVAWSWLAAIFFFQHTWINRVSLVHFVRRSFSRPWTGAGHVAAYAVLVAAALWTWSSAGKPLFTVENYIPLSLYAWVVATAAPYAVWIAVARRSARLGQSHPHQQRAWLTSWRAIVDLMLVPMAALAVLSGIPLTFWDPFMDANGWKYVSKYWHVWPSVVFTVLVFIHSVQLWRPMGAHLRAFDRRRLAGRNVTGSQ